MYQKTYADSNQFWKVWTRILALYARILTSAYFIPKDSL